MRSRYFLLEEQKLKECDLLGKNESTDDSYYLKYVKWTDVQAPHTKTPPARLALDPYPSASLADKPAEPEGIEYCMRCSWSPTLLHTKPNLLMDFPDNPDFNFITWANVDFIVHRNNSLLKSFQIMYSLNECWEWAGYQYGTNDYRDFSNLSPSIECLPPIATSELSPEHRPRLTLPS